MDNNILDQIVELEQKISELPIGSVTKKTVNGHVYYYHRWSENGDRQEKYLPADEVGLLKEQIERRKLLEDELRLLKKKAPKKKAAKKQNFITNIRIGDALRTYSRGVSNFKKRSCYQNLHDYVYGNSYDRVFILYGLRRTGKTTLIRQIIADMSDAALQKAAFIQITAKNNLAQLNQDLKILEEQRYKYIFIDEVTLMEDFIEGAALLSDIFAACGMKIVLSGTDSLGFLFSSYNELYDRCFRLHTTHIPYREFEEILGIQGIDEYIRYGGTMSLGGVHYNEASTFASKKSADEYVDSAIAHNIQHSLECYDNKDHFRHLAELYEQNELTSAINRIVEDITHRFTLEVLTKDFESNDYRFSARNLRRDREHPTDILDRIDIAAFTERLRNLMDIRNKQEQTVEISDAHRAEIKEYLDLLDLTRDIEVRSLPAVNDVKYRTVIAQPGLRYAQANALIQSLMLDETFSDLSLEERTFVTDRILNEIKGRMMEDIVLLETKLAFPKKEVFALQFAIGEFDMVVFDPATSSCEIYEIKHSTEVVPQQYRHLIDEKKCADTKHRFGPITGKHVLYRGEDFKTENGIQYRNVEKYLKQL